MWYGHPSQNSDVYLGFQIPMNHPPTMGISSNCWPWHIWQGYIENCLRQPPFNQVIKRQRKSIISQLQKLHLAGFNIDIIIQYIKPTLSFQMGMNGTIGKGDIYIYITDRLQKLYEEGVINQF